MAPIARSAPRSIPASSGSHWGSNRTAREASVQSNYEVIAKTPNYLVMSAT